MKIITRLLSFCLAFLLSVTTLMPSVALASPSLDPKQQMFIFSMIAYTIADRKGTQEELQELLTVRATEILNTPSIQKDIGDWDVVWGPVVYQNPSSDLDTNSMYVARDGNHYVVAITGTNPLSLYDWFLEDFYVKKQVDWTYGEIPSDLQPKISQGTAIGLNILQSMESSGQTLLEFLSETVQNSADAIEITFTGHSLAGALSPTLALAVFEQRSEWAGDKPVKISVFPYAGLTPGNEDFSAYYDSQLGASTTRVWNDIDLVPHVWNEAMLSEIPSLYEPEIEPGLAIKLLTRLGKDRAKDGHYTQLLPATPGLPGQVSNKTICKQLNTSTVFSSKEVSQIVEDLKGKISQDSELREISSFLDREVDHFLEDFVGNLITFLLEVTYQHVTEYATLLNVEEPYCTINAETGGIFLPTETYQLEQLALRLLLEYKNILSE